MSALFRSFHVEHQLWQVFNACSVFVAASRIRYEITSGNIGGAFAVKNMTGAIYVAGALDYETRKRVSSLLHFTCMHTRVTPRAQRSQSTDETAERIPSLFTVKCFTLNWWREFFRNASVVSVTYEYPIVRALRRAVAKCEKINTLQWI